MITNEARLGFDHRWCHLQDWERCERGIGGSLEKLRAFKRQLSQPLPDHNEDLQAEQMRCKVSTSQCLSVIPCISITHNLLFDIEMFQAQVFEREFFFFQFYGYTGLSMQGFF